MKRLILASSGTHFLKKSPKYLQLEPGSRILYVPTAGYGEKPIYISEAPNVLKDLGYVVEEFDLRDKSSHNTKKVLDEIDMVYVSGGNLFYLLHHSNLSGFGQAVSQKVEEGLPYFGSSAGAMLAGPTIELARPVDDIDVAPDLSSHDGLGLVNFLVAPHWNRKEYSEPFTRQIEKLQAKEPVLKVKDGNAVLVEGEKWRIV